MVFQVVVTGEVLMSDLRSSLNMEMLAPTYQVHSVTSQTTVVFIFTTFYHEDESSFSLRNGVSAKLHSLASEKTVSVFKNEKTEEGPKILQTEARVKVF
jgi:hypothetical protein